MSTDHSTKAPEPGLILTRVSDSKQSGASSQLTACRRLAGLHRVHVVAEVDDDGVSGDDLDREGILEALAVLQKAHKAGRPVRWLIIDQSDRFSRADSLATFAVLARMRDLGLRKIATPRKVFDLYTGIDLTFLGLESDHKNNRDLKDIGRRVLNGMLDAAKGLYWTGHRPPLGLRVVKVQGDHAGRRRRSGKLEIDPDTGPLVADLFGRYLDGASLRDLVAWLALRTGRRWTAPGIAGVLRNEIYTGVRSFGKDAAGKHARLIDGEAVVIAGDADAPVGGDVVRITGFPRLVDDETFARVGARLATGRSRGHRKGHELTPLSGLSKCGSCGAPMYCTSKTAGNAYLVCRNRHHGHPDLCPTSGLARADVVLTRVLRSLSDALLEGDAVAKLVAMAGEAEGQAHASWEADLAGARANLEAAEAALARARRRMAVAPDGLYEDLQAAVFGLKEEAALAQAALDALSAAAPPAPPVADSVRLQEWLANVREVCRWEDGCAGYQTPPGGAIMNAILREVVACVTVHPPEGPAGPGGRRRRGDTVGVVKVDLPDWVNDLLSTMASPSSQQGTTGRGRIVLDCPPTDWLKRLGEKR